MRWTFAVRIDDDAGLKQTTYRVSVDQQHWYRAREAAAVYFARITGRNIDRDTIVLRSQAEPPPTGTAA